MWLNVGILPLPFLSNMDIEALSIFADAVKRRVLS
jgi:hypothetical protein